MTSIKMVTGISALLCAFITADTFGSQQQGTKRKRSDKDQEKKTENVFTLYSQLPDELQRHVISMADLYSLENLAETNHKTRSDVKSVSQLYIGSAQEYAKEMLLLKNELHARRFNSMMEKVAFRDTGRRLATIHHHIEMAQLDHDCREYGLAVSHSRSALAISIPHMPDDKMMIDEV